MSDYPDRKIPTCANPHMGDDYITAQILNLSSGVPGAQQLLLLVHFRVMDLIRSKLGTRKSSRQNLLKARALNAV